jgi:hypothetical protein
MAGNLLLPSFFRAQSAACARLQVAQNRAFCESAVFPSAIAFGLVAQASAYAIFVLPVFVWLSTVRGG